MSCSQPTHSIQFLWDLRHLLLDTNTTLVWWSDSFVHPWGGINPTQKFERYRPHDLNHPQAPVLLCLVSYHSQDISECEGIFALIVLFFLNLSGCFFMCCLRSSLIMFSSCCHSSSPDRHLLSAPGFHRQITCATLLSTPFPLLHSLCLRDSLCESIHSRFARQRPLNNCSYSLSTHIVVWFCRSSIAMPALHTRGQPPTWPRASMSADNTQNLLGSTSGILSTAIIGIWGPALSLPGATFFVEQVHLRNHHRPRSATQAIPVRLCSSFCQHSWAMVFLCVLFGPLPLRGVAVSLKMVSTALETTVSKTRWSLSLSRARCKRIDRVNTHWIWVFSSSRFTRLQITDSPNQSLPPRASRFLGGSSWVSFASRVPQAPLPPDQRAWSHRLMFPSTFPRSATRRSRFVQYQLEKPTESTVQEKWSCAASFVFFRLSLDQTVSAVFAWLLTGCSASWRQCHSPHNSGEP